MNRASDYGSEGFWFESRRGHRKKASQKCEAFLFNGHPLADVRKKSYFHIMYTLNAIVEILQKHKPELQRKYPISRLGVFGSYARGEATENSDIAVDITGPMGLNFVAMADEIEGLFGIKTDVVPKRSIKPAYLPYVEKDIIYV